MTATVAEEDLRHRALIDETVCCETGHPDAGEAARHARSLTRAIARHEANASATPCK